MTDYKFQDIILVNFGFSEGVGFKKRPALIISSDNYHTYRQEVIVLAITSNIKRVLFGDTKIEDLKTTGLIQPSLVCGIIRTIKGDTIIRKIGRLSNQDFLKVKENLIKLIGFALAL